MLETPNAGDEWPVLTEAQAARVLADQAWEGRGNPADYLNVLPLAEHTARALYTAGYVVVERSAVLETAPIDGSGATNG